MPAAPANSAPRLVSQLDHESIARQIAEVGELRVPTLTSEELAAIVGEGDDRGPITPDLGLFRGRPARAAALTAATRSLVARGLLRPPGGPGTDAVDAAAMLDTPHDDEPTRTPTGARVLMVVGTLGIALDLRQRPMTMIVVVRAFPEFSQRIAIYGTDAQPPYFLDERPDPDGFHGFTLRTLDHQRAALLEALDVPEGPSELGSGAKSSRLTADGFLSESDPTSAAINEGLRSVWLWQTVHATRAHADGSKRTAELVLAHTLAGSTWIAARDADVEEALVMPFEDAPIGELVTRCLDGRSLTDW